MAKLTARSVVTISVAFEVDESEARALDAMSGYGDDAFVKAFYDNLGKAYMQEHEAGLRRFLSTIRNVVGPALSQVDEARILLMNAAKARQSERESQKGGA